MKRLYTTVMAISAALLVAGAVHAQASLDSVRIEAKDTDRSCKVLPGGVRYAGGQSGRKPGRH